MKKMEEGFNQMDSNTTRSLELRWEEQSISIMVNLTNFEMKHLKDDIDYITKLSKSSRSTKKTKESLSFVLHFLNQLVEAPSQTVGRLLRLPPSTGLILNVNQVSSIISFLQERHKIRAIKMVRDMAECSLLDAKNAVDYIDRNLDSVTKMIKED